MSTSTGGTADQSTPVTSPRFGTWWWRCSTAQAPGSISLYQTNSPPRTACTAMSRPP
ncbi:hypothetical protein FHS29_005020 [Saccharothrix tamanrassetensis]|uniref:Uncharacterized protein n=1 Tax=Saccharothrix tamanrassetensis TaxID=1051531 RepID=A0A841CIU6_9PSEU|nr:hypothetical protein [Saccharothrix tamanrassetensis]MBB5958412.1 hypothetical protein [Saccharothrix tamanrassetensis]